MGDVSSKSAAVISEIKYAPEITCNPEDVLSGKTEYGIMKLRSAPDRKFMFERLKQEKYSEKFRVIAIPNFIPEAECDILVQTAHKIGGRFWVNDGEGWEKGGLTHLNTRSSYSLPIKSSSIFEEWLNKTCPIIEELLCLPREYCNGQTHSIPDTKSHNLECRGIIRYRKGERFFVHHDVGRVGKKGMLKRYHSLIIYLNDVECGGDTSFPVIGLDIKPRRGMAVFWRNIQGADDNIVGEAIHSGKPPDSGEKFIIPFFANSCSVALVPLC